MSKTAFYIHYTGEWLGFEGPEKPNKYDYGYFITQKPIREFDIDIDNYNQKLSEAAKNSLKILNPEVLKGTRYLELKGGYYQWPGTYTITGWGKNNRKILLTPPAALEEESQEEMWSQVLSDARLYDGTPPGHRFMMERWKGRFTITRKQQTK